MDIYDTLNKMNVDPSRSRTRCVPQMGLELPWNRLLKEQVSSLTIIKNEKNVTFHLVNFK